ncbi:hypothetical protein F5144DRAFT_545281 [Chaetomium tenue]|uniref:Uncharacterized protein n=1 Tax=Chaetomium tenue TaxID=1854479 RepID=A0ACB7PJH0_9PEZI|nr:hypothetical protein F5144DRAFT_545281 [Chaetomium globosum]
MNRHQSRWHWIQRHRTSSYTSNPSHNITDHISQLNIGAGKPSASAAKQGGPSKGKLSSNDVVAALDAIGAERFDEEGHPVYYGIVNTKEGKAVKRVAVNIHGVVVKQLPYFCVGSDGNVFDEPPKVPSKDPNPKISGKLYELEKKLYSGKMAAAPIPQAYHKAHHDGPAYEGGHHYDHAGAAYPAYDNVGQYHGYDPNTPYRPSTASSGGSGGAYTTRPSSRDGAAAASGYTSIPRTTAHNQHPGTHHNASASRPSSRDGATGPATHDRNAGAYHNATESRPSSRGSTGQGPPPVPKSGSSGAGPSKPLTGGGPSKPPAAANNPSSAQGTPQPPRRVRLDSSKREIALA